MICHLSFVISLMTNIDIISVGVDVAEEMGFFSATMGQKTIFAAKSGDVAKELAVF